MYNVCAGYYKQFLQYYVFRGTLQHRNYQKDVLLEKGPDYHDVDKDGGGGKRLTKKGYIDIFSSKCTSKLESA